MIEKKIADVIVTTVGGIEEDIMKAHGEKFMIGNFNTDDVELHEQGVNRVGNLLIESESYMKFEDLMKPILDKLYVIKKRWAVSDMLREIGLMLDDEDSILFQAAKNNVPIFVPLLLTGVLDFICFCINKIIAILLLMLLKILEIFCLFQLMMIRKVLSHLEGVFQSIMQFLLVYLMEEQSMLCI